KVGARNAQAISKVCIAALGRIRQGIVDDARIAVGSVAPVPLRLSNTERLLRGQRIDDELVRRITNTAIEEIQPINDIRSTAVYRSVVFKNLVTEFLVQLAAGENQA